ncbi:MULTISPECIES: alpha/beta fold hydrolase [Mumia]|uniref:alpha/beta fold hydrolase n=1 Tax=Mumia TaxID=1546255 RepID=UPI00141FED0F|nr:MULTISPECIES: alpha/beta hydrolase [unclassified Mumia]QMW65178.1 alpha/beta hydrolase [Mumia sp. ZJ1417]
MHRDVLSDDGTRIRAWTNRAEGPTVLLCNGLGTSPYAWPALLDPGCGVRVVSWYHRGIGGSERPRDRSRVDIDAHLEDAHAVMRAFAIDHATVVGWSIGVNLAFELAVRWPERVDAVLGVAGVPGDTFATMLGPARLPRPVARATTVSAARLVQVAGAALNPLTQRLHRVPYLFDAARYTGLMLPRAEPAAAAETLKAFFELDWRWYMHLALHLARHERVSLSKVTQPTTLVGARWDVFAGARQMRSAAARITGARYVELDASHFVALEHPDAVHAELLALLRRVTP